jgi:hypothetical protein
MMMSMLRWLVFPTFLWATMSGLTGLRPTTMDCNFKVIWNQQDLAYNWSCTDQKCQSTTSNPQSCYIGMVSIDGVAYSKCRCPLSDGGWWEGECEVLRESNSEWICVPGPGECDGEDEECFEYSPQTIREWTVPGIPCDCGIQV